MFSNGRILTHKKMALHCFTNDKCIMRSGPVTEIRPLLGLHEKSFTCNYQGRSLLHLAAKEGDLEKVQTLISRGANVNSIDRFGDQPLKIAMMCGHKSVAYYLRYAGAFLSHDANADLVQRMCRFSAEGDIESVKRLIEAGVSVNSCDYDGRTPLHFAVAHGHLHLAQYLISQGADIQKKDCLGRDAMDDSCIAHNPEVKELLNQVAHDHDMQQIIGLNMDTVEDLSTAFFPKQQNLPTCAWQQPPLITDLPNLEICDCSGSITSVHDSLASMASYLTSKAMRVDSGIRWSNTKVEVNPGWQENLCFAVTKNPYFPIFRPSPRCRTDAPHNAGSRRAKENQDDYAFMSLADDQSEQPLFNGSNQPDGKGNLHFGTDKEMGENDWNAGIRLLYPSQDIPNSRSARELSSLIVHAKSLGLASVGSTGSIRLRNYAAPGATVLVMDIKGFTAGCAAMSAAEVGEWVAEFYSRVDGVAAAHGVRKAEVRGDCCICVAGTAASVPWAELRGAARGASPGPAAEADGRWDQVTRMLSFAADVHAALATLKCAGGATSVRMGMATGDLSLLVGDGGAGGGFVSVQGEAMRLATRMESQSEPGTVLAHRSALDKWVAEGAGAAAGAGGARAAPKTVQVDCGGGEGRTEEAAAYDFAARGFRRPAPFVPPALLGKRGASLHPNAPGGGEPAAAKRPRSRSIG